LRKAIILLAGYTTLAAAQPAISGKATGLTVYVADFGTDPGAATVRERLIDAILSRSNLSIVPTMGEANAVLVGSVSTHPVVRFGTHLEDLKGKVLCAFDEAKCGSWLTKPFPGTLEWEIQQNARDSGLYNCAPKQLSRIITKRR
jgi:hypothetical protein